jgi:hypothetical protein
MSLIANFKDFRTSKIGLNESSDSKIYTVENIGEALEILDLLDYYNITFKTFLKSTFSSDRTSVEVQGLVSAVDAIEFDYRGLIYDLKKKISPSNTENEVPKFTFYEIENVIKSIDSDGDFSDLEKPEVIKIDLESIPAVVVDYGDGQPNHASFISMDDIGEAWKDHAEINQNQFLKIIASKLYENIAKRVNYES